MQADDRNDKTMQGASLKARTALPSFEETFWPRSNCRRKSAVKRRCDIEEKVKVLPVQNDSHFAKRMRSEWDLLFYNEDGNTERQDTLTGLPPFLQVTQPECCSHKNRQSFVVREKEMKRFFRLLDDDLIQDFMFMDRCMKISDKYLIAMVFAYFKRSGYMTREYTKTNFFVALYLANDMEEDEEELKYEIFPWALGDKWKDKFPKFLAKRDALLKKIDYRAVVSRRCCEDIMAIEPDHSIWTRNRPEHHGGAVRGYMKDPDDDGYPRGPTASPQQCKYCDHDSQYDSASPSSVSWLVSSDDSSPWEEPDELSNVNNSTRTMKGINKSTFDMKGLKTTLQEDDWPKAEE